MIRDEFSNEAEKELIYNIAYGIYSTLPSYILMEDLIQAGYLGMMEARSNYKYGHNGNFSTFAIKRVRGAMIDFLRKQDWTPRYVSRAKRKTSKATHRLEQKELGRVKSRHVAAHLKKDLNQFYKDEEAIKFSKILTFHDNLDHEWDEDELNEGLANRAEKITQLEQAFDAIMDFDRVLKKVMIMQYVLGYSQTEIANEFGFSRARICQLNHKGIMAIKKKLGQS